MGFEVLDSAEHFNIDAGRSEAASIAHPQSSWQIKGLRGQC